MSEKEPKSFEEMMLPEDSLWLLIPRAFGLISLSVIVILLRFYEAFGEIPPMAYGFSIFIVVFQILLIIGYRFQNRPEVHVTKPLKGDWLDFIGAFWLVACAFGAFFGWICLNLASGFPVQAKLFHILNVFFSLILPIFTMIPLLRYIQKKSAYLQIPILFFVTLLPTLVSLSSIIALINS